MVLPVQEMLYIVSILYFAGAVFYLLGNYSGRISFFRLALWTSAAGGFCNFLAIMMRTIVAGRLPLANGYEFILSYVFVTVLLYLILERRSGSQRAGWMVMTLAAFLIVFVMANGQAQLTEAGNLMPALKSPWLAFHVVTAVLSYAGFTLAAGMALVDVMQTKSEKRNDRVYVVVGAAFVMLTLSIVFGAVWAEQAWGTYWSWDPKEDWALISWIVYASYLHLHRRREWRGKRSNWMVIIGFLIVLFTFFGVNYLMSGLHSYA